MKTYHGPHPTREPWGGDPRCRVQDIDRGHIVFIATFIFIKLITSEIINADFLFVLVLLSILES
jgi:hypothetical protein